MNGMPECRAGLWPLSWHRAAPWLLGRGSASVWPAFIRRYPAPLLGTWLPELVVWPAGMLVCYCGPVRVLPPRCRPRTRAPGWLRRAREPPVRGYAVVGKLSSSACPFTGLPVSRNQQGRTTPTPRWMPALAFNGSGSKLERRPVSASRGATGLSPTGHPPHRYRVFPSANCAPKP